MPNVVFTKNSVTQHSPYGAVDRVFTEIEDIQIRESSPDFNYSEEDPGAVGPGSGDLSIMLFRPQFVHQIPSNALNVRCRVYFKTGGGFSDFTVEARQVLKPWMRFSASFNENITDLGWQTPGAQGAEDRGAATDSATVGPSSNQWVSLDADAAGASLVADPRNNQGIGVFPVQPDSGFWFAIKSDNGPDGDKPEIHFSYDLPAGGGSAVLVGLNLPRLLDRTVPRLLAASEGPNPTPTVALRRIFVWGHSLFNHALFMANAFTNTGFTMGELSRQSFNRIGIKQIFGQLRDQVLPPPQGSQVQTITNQVDPWPASPATSWESANWTDAFVMASNFEQVSKTPAEFADESDAVLTYAETNSPTTQLIIYEHWAEPSQYGLSVINTNEMGASDWATYKALHQQGGTYHTWHLNYQTEIETDGHTITMVPVGPCIMDALQNEAYLSTIEFEDLFVDNAPHPNATMSFLASLVCYLALFDDPNPAFTPAQLSFLNVAVANNLASLISYFRSRLIFYGANGVNLPT